MEAYSNTRDKSVVKYHIELVRKTIVVGSKLFHSSQYHASLSVSCFLLSTFSFATPICFKLKEWINLPLSQFRTRNYHVCKCVETTIFFFFVEMEWGKLIADSTANSNAPKTEEGTVLFYLHQIMIFDYKALRFWRPRTLLHVICEESNPLQFITAKFESLP